MLFSMCVNFFMLHFDYCSSFYIFLGLRTQNTEQTDKITRNTHSMLTWIVLSLPTFLCTICIYIHKHGRLELQHQNMSEGTEHRHKENDEYEYELRVR